MRVYLVLSQNIVCFAYFYTDMQTTSNAAGKNMRGTQGSLKKWSESLNKCENPERKRSTLCFVAVIRQPGNVLKEVDRIL